MQMRGFALLAAIYAGCCVLTSCITDRQAVLPPLNVIAEANASEIQEHGHENGIRDPDKPIRLQTEVKPLVPWPVHLDGKLNPLEFNPDKSLKVEGKLVPDSVKLVWEGKEIDMKMVWPKEALIVRVEGGKSGETPGNGGAASAERIPLVQADLTATQQTVTKIENDLTALKKSIGEAQLRAESKLDQLTALGKTHPAGQNSSELWWLWVVLIIAASGMMGGVMTACLEVLRNGIYDGWKDFLSEALIPVLAGSIFGLLAALMIPGVLFLSPYRLENVAKDMYALISLCSMCFIAGGSGLRIIDFIRDELRFRLDKRREFWEHELKRNKQREETEI